MFSSLNSDIFNQYEVFITIRFENMTEEETNLNYSFFVFVSVTFFPFSSFYLLPYNFSFQLLMIYYMNFVGVEKIQVWIYPVLNKAIDKSDLNDYDFIIPSYRQKGFRTNTKTLCIIR